MEKTNLKLVEIKDLASAEITEQLKKSRIELVDLRMKLTSRQLENPSQIFKKRKEIARLLTIQTQKLVSNLEEPKSKPKTINRKKEKEVVQEESKKKKKR